MIKKLSKVISKVLLTVILSLILLIAFRKSDNFKLKFYTKVYDNNFNFGVVNKIYKKYFGSQIPFKNLFNKSDNLVFNEKLSYKNLTEYKSGACLELSSALIPSTSSGLVVFVGEKDDYGKTVIVEQTDGVEVWYGNFSNIDVKLYDYIENDTVIGEVLDNKLYLVYKKDGNVLNYEDYI